MIRAEDELTNAHRGSIEIGVTGTIGSLISRELESIGNSPLFSRKEHQTSPSLVHYTAISKKPIKKKALQNDFGSSSSSNYNHERRRSVRCNGIEVPILRVDTVYTERNSNVDAGGKKHRVYAAEVVDVKCSNLFTRRPRKIGFAKLSGLIA